MSAQNVHKLEITPAAEPGFYNGIRLAAALNITPYALAGEPEPSSNPSPASGDPGFAQTAEFAALVARFEALEEAFRRLQPLIERGATPPTAWPSAKARQRGK